MKKLYVAMVAAVISSGAATVAQAFDGAKTGYVGVSYGEHTQKTQLFDKGKATTDNIFLRLGGDISPVFSSELKLGFNTKKASGSSSIGENMKVQNSYIATALLRAGHDIGVFKPYVAAGYSFAKEKAQSDAGKMKASAHGLSYGAGIDASVSEDVVLNVEWLQLVERSSVDLKGWTVGVAVRF